MDDIRIRKTVGPLSFTACAFVCALLFTSKVTATDAPTSIEISVSDQQVTLDADNVDLRQVLELLADKADFTLWISDELQGRKVTASFDKEPLRVALSRLMQNTSYALVQDSENNSVAALYVLPLGKAQTVMMEVKPEVVVETEQIMQNFTPNIFVDVDKIIQDALQADTVPDDIKAALSNRGDANPEASAQEFEVKRTNTMTQMIDIFEKHGMANPETIRELRETLEQKPALQ